MVGYQRGAEPELSFVNRYVDLDLMAYVQNVTATYLPDLATSETTACCSDHQSFLENGYASAGFVEAGGYTIDPQYHNTSTKSARGRRGLGRTGRNLKPDALLCCGRRVCDGLR